MYESPGIGLESDVVANRRLAVRAAAVASLIASIATAGALTVAVAPAASADDLSSGCNLVNNTGFDSRYSSASGSMTFVAGERVEFAAGEPAVSPPPTQITLTVGGATVASAGFPGTVAYTFGADTTTDVKWATGSPAGEATWNASCGLAPEPPASAAGPGSSAGQSTAWLLAYARPSADARCRLGWNPSWGQWPNNGTGGYTCERTIR